MRTPLFVAVTFASSLVAASAGAQEIDPLLGPLDEAVAADLRAQIEDANAAVPRMPPVRPGRGPRGRVIRPTEVTAADLEVARAFILTAVDVDLALALRIGQRTTTPFARIEDVVSWIAMAIADEQIELAEATFPASRAVDAIAMRDAWNDAVTLRGSTPAEVRALRPMIAHHHADFERVFELWKVSAQTPPARRITIE